MSRRVAIATEGSASGSVIQEICIQAGVAAIVRSTEGKPKLRQQFHKLLASCGPADAYLVVPDLHPEVDCAEESAWWHQEIAKRFPQAKVCLAIWESEAWLIADPEALKNVLGISVDVPNPDTVGGSRPADVIEHACRVAFGFHKGSNFDKKSDGERVARRLNLKSARQRSPSLDRFIRLVAG